MEPGQASGGVLHGGSVTTHFPETERALGVLYALAGAPPPTFQDRRVCVSWCVP